LDRRREWLTVINGELVYSRLSESVFLLYRKYPSCFFPVKHLDNPAARSHVCDRRREAAERGYLLSAGNASASSVQNATLAPWYRVKSSGPM
jgi:hypothetical protein